MNIALIGLGLVARTHVTAIRSSKLGLHLSGVFGRNPDRAQRFAQENDTRAFQSIDEIAQDHSIDFVILATPPDARIEIVQTLAACGKPILMEKPIERNLTAATRIVEICEQFNTPLGIVFQHRVRDASIALKQAIETGQLGRIETADLRVPWWRDQTYYDEPGRGTFKRDGGGVMISQAIHTLDMAMWLLGGITSVQAMMRQTQLHQLEAEDWAAMLFETEKGVVGSMMATTAAFPGHAETITLQGTKAAAHLGSGVLTLTFLNGETQTTGASAATGGGADPMGFTHAWHQSVIEDFAAAIAANITPPISGRNALGTHAVIEAMQQSNATGQRTSVAL